MALWTPALIDTALWLDAADSSTITESGGAVSQWDDKSGNDLHVTQGGSTAQPGYISGALNGLNVVRFDGSNDFLWRGASGAFRNRSSMLIYSVLNPTSVLSDRRYLNVTTPSSNDAALVLLGVGRSVSKWVIAGRRLHADSYVEKFSSGNASGATIVGNLYDYQGASYEMFIDGVSEGSSAFQTSGNTADADEQRIAIGVAAGLSTTFWYGDIAEQVLVPDDVTTETRHKIEGYLAWKWGLEANLPGEHPYKNAAPVSAFVWRFYGTVRDKNGALSERRVTAILDSTGECVGTALSDPVTGEYAVETTVDEPHTLIFTGEADRNALVYTGVMPEEVP